LQRISSTQSRFGAVSITGREALARRAESAYRQGKSVIFPDLLTDLPMPDEPTLTDKKSKVMSRTALALGAAGLFLFIVGIKRKHRLDNERDIAADRERDRGGE
jgi:hypothetical protein